MNELKKRPWYSFRWRILFWIAVPIIWITLVDSLATLILVWHRQK